GRRHRRARAGRRRRHRARGGGGRGGGAGNPAGAGGLASGPEPGGGARPGQGHHRQARHPRRGAAAGAGRVRHLPIAVPRGLAHRRATRHVPHSTRHGGAAGPAAGAGGAGSGRQPGAVGHHHRRAGDPRDRGGHLDLLPRPELHGGGPDRSARTAAGAGGWRLMADPRPGRRRWGTRCWGTRRRAPRWRDRGAAPIELAIVWPAILLLVFGAVQVATYFTARTVALSAAQVGVTAARGYDATDADGRDRAEAFLAQAGDWLVDWQVIGPVRDETTGQ